MISSRSDRHTLLKPNFGNLFGSLFITFFVMLIVVGAFQMLLDNLIEDVRMVFLCTSICQSVLVFIFPSYLTAKLCIANPDSYLGITEKVRVRQFIGVLILFIIGLPALNLVIDWNSNMSLPDSMAGMESMMREWEETAEATTSMVLGDRSLWGLISGVLVVGCLTGLAEEMFFRAGIQQALIKCGSGHHLAIWIAAFIFSAIHFQFFGFFPRLIIGAALGYIFYYSGSIWVAAFGHAFNNSLVVVMTWLAARGYVSFELDKIGTGSENDLWIALLSIVITVGFIFFCGRSMFGINNDLRSIKK